jgi:hypothetical protein
MKQFDNTTLKNNPAIMAIICNIQMIQRKLMIPETSFNTLENMKYGDLHAMQNGLVEALMAEAK